MVENKTGKSPRQFWNRSTNNVCEQKLEEFLLSLSFFSFGYICFIKSKFLTEKFRKFFIQKCSEHILKTFELFLNLRWGADMSHAGASLKIQK